ncbi:hypothetical protein ABZ614_35320 [Streptomyces sp. NPDC013178]|uniref:hypothetical protein n=1 Tax=Streptomyces sp. NPDC013178 TaxID=3155118 RepID=UPI0033DA3AE4
MTNKRTVTVRTRCTTLGVFGVLLSVLLSAFAAGPVQAATDSPRAEDSHTMIMPPAPEGAPSPTSRVAAASPTISPSANYVHATSGNPVDCDEGYLCPAVWDPSAGAYKVFFLYYCNRYSLSNWNGRGQVVNNQIGAAAFFYGQNGEVLDAVLPDRVAYDYDWTPVWHIRNC